MHELTINQLKKFIRYVTLTLGEPLLIEGTFGIGKSEAMAQVALENPDDMLVDVRLSQRDSVDLRGGPGTVQETYERTVGKQRVKEIVNLWQWFMPSELPFKGNPRFMHVKGIIWLFLDEINAAPLPVLAAAYQLVNDRRIGEHVLMDNVRVVAAGNLATDKGVVNRMPVPLLNRFVQVRAVVSVDDFCDYHIAKGDLPPIAIAFYKFQKDLLHTYNPKSADTVFSTPRTAAKAWRAWMTDAPMWMREAVMAGCVGEGVMQQIKGFIRIWDTLKDYIPKIKIDPVGVSLPSDQTEEGLGLRYALAVKLSGDMDKQSVTWIHPFLKRLNPDITIMAWTLAVRRDTSIIQTPEYIDYAKSYAQAFT